MRVPRNPEMQSIKRNPHRKPFKKVKPISKDRAAELIAAAKKADIIHLRYNGGTWMDFTEERFDKYEGVKK